MGLIAKTLFLPLLILLPWVLIKMNNWDGELLTRLNSQPDLLFMLLLPSIVLSIRWFARIFSSK